MPKRRPKRVSATACYSWDTVQMNLIPKSDMDFSEAYCFTWSMESWTRNLGLSLGQEEEGDVLRHVLVTMNKALNHLNKHFAYSDSDIIKPLLVMARAHVQMPCVRECEDRLVACKRSWIDLRHCLLFFSPEIQN